MHLKLFFITLLFFTLTSAENDSSIIRKPELKQKPKIFVAPKKQSKTYVMPVQQNNVWNKTQAEIIDCKIKINKERDTIRTIIDSVKIANNE